MLDDLASAKVRGRASAEALALSLARLTEDERRRVARSQRWPLAPDEVARRAEADARPLEWAWQASAVDPGCPECGALGRACVGHLGAWAYQRVAALGDCEWCGGFGFTIGFVDGKSDARRIACSACNAVPRYVDWDDRRAAAARSSAAAAISWARSQAGAEAVGLVLPELADAPGDGLVLWQRCWSGQRRPRETAEELARARAWWARFAPAAEAVDDLLLD